MNCLAAFVLSCLFDPSNIYLTAQFQVNLYDEGGYGRAWCDGYWCHGQIAQARLGMSIPLSKGLDLDYGITHESFYNSTRDRGEESAFVSVTWRPFR